MAEFIIGNPLRGWARERPGLRRVLWRLDHALVWTLLKLFRLLPVDAASRTGALVGGWIGPRLKHKSRIFRENFAIALPALSPAELDAQVLRAWREAGRVLAEYPHLDKILRDHDRLRIEHAVGGNTVQLEQPCVLVSAHLSNWEVICSALTKLGVPNASLYSPPTNPLLDDMLRQSRAALNCTLLPRDNSARSLMQALQAGRSVGMVIDRRVDEGRPVPFFNQHKPSTLLPAKLALKYGCPLVPVQVKRLRDARFRVIFHPPVTAEDPQADESARVLDMMGQVHALFEDWIRANPDDWFCAKRLWPRDTLRRLRATRNDDWMETHAT